MKIGWKTVFSTVWQKKENAEDRKPGRKFSLLGPQFSSSQIRRKIVERKVLSQHLYKNALIATIITIFLSTISKLKHNQIIRIQTQKHNFKINQIITIKAKKKKKKKKKKKRKEKTKDRRQKPSDPSGLRLGRLFWNQVKKKRKTKRESWRNIRERMRALLE